MENIVGYAEECAARYLETQNVHFCGCENMVSLLLSSLNFCENDEIIVSSNLSSDISSFVRKSKVKVVLSDIDKETLNPDVSDIAEKITSRTCAIVVSHAFGELAEIERISSQLCAKNIMVIEECIDVLGAVRFGDGVIYRPGHHGFGCVIEPDFAFISSKKLPLPDVFENGGENAAENFLRRQPEFETQNGDHRLAASRYEKLIYELGLLHRIKPNTCAQNSFVTSPSYPVRAQSRDELYDYLKSQKIVCEMPKFVFNNTDCQNFENVKRELLILPTKDVSFELQKKAMDAIKKFYMSKK